MDSAESDELEISVLLTTDRAVEALYSLNQWDGWIPASLHTYSGWLNSIQHQLYM